MILNLAPTIYKVGVLCQVLTILCLAFFIYRNKFLPPPPCRVVVRIRGDVCKVSGMLSLAIPVVSLFSSRSVGNMMFWPEAWAEGGVVGLN